MSTTPAEVAAYSACASSARDVTFDVFAAAVMPWMTVVVLPSPSAPAAERTPALVPPPRTAAVRSRAASGGRRRRVGGREGRGGGGGGGDMRSPASDQSG